MIYYTTKIIIENKIIKISDIKLLKIKAFTFQKGYLCQKSLWLYLVITKKAVSLHRF
jgi:hypothetical protein